MTTGLEGLLDIRQKNDMLNALIFLVEYTGTALLSWAGPGKGIWEGRPSNLEPKDYFSWRAIWRNLSLYGLWSFCEYISLWVLTKGTANSSLPLCFKERGEVGRTISWSTHKAWEMPFLSRLPIRYSHWFSHKMIRQASLAHKQLWNVFPDLCWCVMPVKV